MTFLSGDNIWVVESFLNLDEGLEKQSKEDQRRAESLLRIMGKVYTGKKFKFPEEMNHLDNTPIVRLERIAEALKQLDNVHQDQLSDSSSFLLLDQR